MLYINICLILFRFSAKDTLLARIQRHINTHSCLNLPLSSIAKEILCLFIKQLVCHLNMEMYLTACLCIMHENTLTKTHRFRLHCLFGDIIPRELVQFLSHNNRCRFFFSLGVEYYISWRAMLQTKEYLKIFCIKPALICEDILYTG